jgi:hypothetical protein
MYETSSLFFKNSPLVPVFYKDLMVNSPLSIKLCSAIYLIFVENIFYSLQWY